MTRWFREKKNLPEENNECYHMDKFLYGSLLGEKYSRDKGWDPVYWWQNTNDLENEI